MERGWDILVVDSVYFYVVRAVLHEGQNLLGVDLTYAEAERVMYRLRDSTR